MFQKNKFLTYLNIRNATVNDQSERVPLAAIKKMEDNSRQRNVTLVIYYERKPTDLDQPLILDTKAGSLKRLLLQT